MARRDPFDPLKLLPSSATVRAKLAETELLASRLRILLDVSERVERATTDEGRSEPLAHTGREVVHAG